MNLLTDILKAIRVCYSITNMKLFYFFCEINLGFKPTMKYCVIFYKFVSYDFLYIIYIFIYISHISCFCVYLAPRCKALEIKQ